MLIRVGLENDVEGRSVAWTLDFPGCFAYGKDASTEVWYLGRLELDHPDQAFKSATFANLESVRAELSPNCPHWLAQKRYAVKMANFGAHANSCAAPYGTNATTPTTS